MAGRKRCALKGKKEKEEKKMKKEEKWGSIFFFKSLRMFFGPFSNI